MKPITTSDLSPGVRLAAARTKAALHSDIRRRLAANPSTRALPAEQLDAIAEDAADACVQHILQGSAVTINVNVTGK